MSVQQPTIMPDRSLLELMLKDHKTIDPRWQATAYWQDIANPLCHHFSESVNIVNFRKSAIRTGIRSVLPSNPGRKPALTDKGMSVASLLKNIPFIGSLLRHQDQLINMSVAEHDNLFRQSLALSYLLLKEIDQEREVLNDFMIGNPDDIVVIDGKNYSYRLLGYQYLYLQAINRISDQKIDSVLELGSGYGGQAEVFLRKNRKLKYIAMDIPPWLYIAEIYLKAIFPGQVLGYRETREINSRTALLELMNGSRIAIVPAWKWPYLDDKYDLFWNSKSLQEMNDNAAPYIDCAVASCKRIFLHAYSTPRKDVHSPASLRELVASSLLMKEIMYEEDLYAGRGSISMMFEK